MNWSLFISLAYFRKRRSLQEPVPHSMYKNQDELITFPVYWTLVCKHKKCLPHSGFFIFRYACTLSALVSGIDSFGGLCPSVLSQKPPDELNLVCNIDLWAVTVWNTVFPFLSLLLF